MGKLEETFAELDTYTDYCKLLEKQIAQAEETVAKATDQAVSTINLVTAKFPYGVGPTIMAIKAQVTQGIKSALEVAEQAAEQTAIASKLLELEIPEGGCS